MQDKKPRLTSAVLVVHEGKFLLGERNKKNYNGYWIIPGGGVEFGETAKEAGIREVKEETNLDVEIIDLIAPKEIINVPGDYHSITFFHLGRALTTDIKVGDDLSDAKFFTLEELKKLKISESVEWVLKKAGYWV